MKTIIAGSRTATMTDVFDAMDNCPWQEEITEVVSGCEPKGADRCGENWALAAELPVKRFPANWLLGKSGGPIRNREMARYADALIAVWDGKSRGTANMIEEAKKCGLRIMIAEFRLTNLQ